jgi:hypothetical protein
MNSRSSILPDTPTPKWDDEEWIIRNIPLDAKLCVVVFDKDDEKLADDYIGQFEIPNLINYHAPDDGHEINTPSGQCHGRFNLTIKSME